MAAVGQRPKVRNQLRLVGRRQERRQENQVRKVIVERAEELVFRVDERQPSPRKIARASQGNCLLRIRLEGKHGRVWSSQSGMGRHIQRLRKDDASSIRRMLFPVNLFEIYRLPGQVDRYPGV